MNTKPHSRPGHPETTSSLSLRALYPPHASFDREAAGAGPAAPAGPLRSAPQNRIRPGDDLDEYGESYTHFENLDPTVSEAILERRKAHARSAVPSAKNGDGRPTRFDDGTRAADSADRAAARPASGAITYRSDRCAFQPPACDHCRIVCPENAIRREADRLRINEAACVACGLCAAVCPTGGMSVSAVTAQDLLAVLHGRVADAHMDDRRSATVIFYQAADRHADHALDAQDRCRPVVAMPLDRIGWAGPEVWLGTLAYGAGQVLIQLPEGCPPDLQQGLESQLHWTAALLEAIAIGGGRVRMLQPGEAMPTSPDTVKSVWPPGEFSPFQSKRELIYDSALHLARHAGFAGAAVPLPDGAPFGRIRVDSEACTLCMACCGSCPTGALANPGDAPALTLNEAACIQCGACRRICPEEAVRLDPQLSLQPDAAGRPQTIHEQQPFACVRCGRGFAAPGMVAKIMARLEGHWMYNDGHSLRRLKMCPDCRVRELFESQQ